MLAFELLEMRYFTRMCGQVFQSYMMLSFSEEQMPVITLGKWHLKVEYLSLYRKLWPTANFNQENINYVDFVAIPDHYFVSWNTYFWLAKI